MDRLSLYIFYSKPLYSFDVLSNVSLYLLRYGEEFLKVSIPSFHSCDMLGNGLLVVEAI